MTVQEIAEEIHKKDEDDAVFGIYQKDQEIAINGGDWLDNELANFIDNLCKEHGFTTTYEAEVSDSFFIKQGFTKIK